jgi:hypothetical protein
MEIGVGLCLLSEDLVLSIDVVVICWHSSKSYANVPHIYVGVLVNKVLGEFCPAGLVIFF